MELWKLATAFFITAFKNFGEIHKNISEPREFLYKILLLRSVQRCSVKKVFLKISQNSQENTCARVSFMIKLQAATYNFIEKDNLA